MKCSNLSILKSLCSQSTRNVSALYITGDKAKENFVTLQPYMDFEKTLFKERTQLEDSIKHRKLQVNLKEIEAKYNNFKIGKSRLEQLENERDLVAKQLKDLSKVSIYFIRQQ